MSQAAKPAICIAKNPVHHDRIKHVEIDRHFIKEKIEGGIVKMVYIHISSQIPDISQRPFQVPRIKFDNMTTELNWSQITEQRLKHIIITHYNISSLSLLFFNLQITINEHRQPKLQRKP